MTWSDKRISTCMYLSICLKMASKYCNTCVYNELKLLTAHIKIIKIWFLLLVEMHVNQNLTPNKFQGK